MKKRLLAMLLSVVMLFTLTAPAFAASLPQVNTPPETVPLDRTNGALGPLKWCIATAAMVH